MFSKKRKKNPRCKEFVYSMEILYEKILNKYICIFLMIYVHKKQKAGNMGSSRPGKG